MKIAFDITPISNIGMEGHKVRGAGFYIQSLRRTFLEYFPKNDYVFFTKDDSLANDIDVVHFPYFEPFFLSLPYIKNCKNVVTVHDLTPFVFPEHFSSGIRGKIKWFFQKTALQKMHAIITDSDNSKKDIHKYTGIPLEKIYVVYLAAGVEFKKKSLSKDIKDKLRKKYKLPSEFVLYVGDATWNKNLPRLVKGVVKTGYPLVMVGKALVSEGLDSDNPWNKDLVTVQKELEGNKNIIRVGFVNTNDLVILYNMAKVFVMPSLYEGFGLPILEAMSCGTPVVTARSGSIPEVAKESVLYVDPYDSDDIALGVKSVFLDKGLRYDLSERGLEQAAKFSWNETARKTLEVYKEVLDMS